MRVYFDNAATTPIRNEVVEVMTKCLSENFGNPSSSHSFGRESKAMLEESRRKIAKLLSVQPSEIIFTSCGTESNNVVLRKSIENLGIERIITTAIEHPSIMSTVDSICKDVEIEYVDICEKGCVLIDELEKLLKESSKKTLVSIMHANNEMGALNDIDSIAKLVKQYNAYSHSDMVQTMGHLPIDLANCPLDFVSASAHKFHGPKGVGFLFVRKPIQITPMISGGSQERGLRSGTENLASIVGMATALELAVANVNKDIVYLNSLRGYMKEKLSDNIPNVQFLTDMDRSLCTVLSVIFPPEFDSEMLLFQLDMKGVACSGGSACSSGGAKPSHILSQFSIPEKHKVIRFSFSKFNKMDEIDYCVSKIQELIAERAA